MASNLPAVINNNQLADTLRALFTPNTNQHQQVMMMKRMFGNMFNQKQSNNGAEDFFTKDSMLELHGRLEKMQKTMENINDNIKSMAEIEEEINDREENDFYREQREEAAAKRETKQITLLEKILKQLDYSRGNGNGGLPDDSILGGGKGLLAALGITSIASFLKGGLKKLGVAGLSLGAVSGAFDAERITGSKDLTGILGAGKILGASIAGLFSALTFGFVNDKDIYNFMTTAIPDVVSEVYKNVKKMATDTISMIDKDLENWLGNNYKVVRDSLGKKLTDIKNLAQNLGSKAFSMLTGTFDTVYDYGLDLINWVSGWRATELNAQPSSLPSSESSKATGIVDKTIGMAKDITGLATGQTQKNIDAANKLGLTAQWRAADPNVEKSTGYCYRGVKRTLLESGLVDHYLPGLHAYEAAEQFEKLGWEEMGGKGWKTDNPNIVKSLPPGYLVVWNRDKNKKGDSGHVAITIGNGMEMSDHERSLDKSISQRGKFGYRIFAPYKPLMQGISDSADTWVYNKVKSAGNWILGNLSSFVSGEQNALGQTLTGISNDLSGVDTVGAEDARVKSVVSEANKAQQTATVKSEPAPAPNVNIVNNSSTVIPQDTSSSDVVFEWTFKNSLLPNRKF